MLIGTPLSFTTIDTLLGKGWEGAAGKTTRDAGAGSLATITPFRLTLQIARLLQSKLPLAVLPRSRM